MGQAFEGIGIVGYNNEKQQYQSLWIDNMGTGMMTASGNYDPDGNRFRVMEIVYTRSIEE